MTTWEEFKQIATQIAAQEGFPLSVLLAQAALETGRRCISSDANPKFVDVMRKAVKTTQLLQQHFGES